MSEAEAPRDFSGRRILIVEDEALVAMSLADLLRDLDCVVIGPAERLDTALDLAGRESLDAALLDVNLAGEPVLPVADQLAKRGIPFVFLTGYGAAGGPARYGDAPTLAKPFRHSRLVAVLAAVLKIGAR